MLIAITSTGQDMDSPMDERFGRARYILIFDDETEKVHVLDNHDNLNAAQGAGIQVAQQMADQHVAWILTGHVGPKAFQAIQKAGVKVGSGCKGTCREVLDQWKIGLIQPLSAADATSHWG